MPLLLAGALLLAAGQPALAARPSHIAPSPGKARPPHPLGTHAEEQAEAPQLTEVPAAATQTTLAGELGSSGQVDPLTGLGIRNPVCDQLAQIRAAATRTACEAAGAPEATYPASNYGFDVFIPTGITHPIGDFTAAFVTILNGIWLGLLFVLRLTLALLGLAFGLNPFADGPTMARISATVARVYAEITEPWLPALVVCAGIAMAYRGLIRRDVAGSAAGTLAAIAMLIAGLWVVHSPRQSVGQLAAFSDEAALTAIAAPQSGSLGRPSGAYAEAIGALWERLVEVPFAGLDFSDVGWALGPPPAEAVKRADEKFCEDNGALALLNQLAKLGIEDAKDRCAQFAQRRYGPPHSVVDLYLRSSPGSAARAALWNYFDNDPRYKPKVAAQGGDGVITRLSMLALFAIGLLGAILLLAWLAIRLFTQAAIAFVLLLAAPFALFLPLLGEAGRRGFRRWGLGLAGALLAKVIYAAFLSIVLLGILILGRVEGPAGSATGFLLAAAFSWAVFLKRSELIGWVSVGEHERLAQLGGLGGLAALGLSHRRLRAHTEPRAKRTATALARRGRERAELGREATRATARESLAASARALAEQRHAQVDGAMPGERKPSSTEPRREPGAAAPRKPRPAAPDGSLRPKDSSAPSPRPHDPSHRAGPETRERAERQPARRAERLHPRELARFAREDRELLRRSTDPADHAHRAGIERQRFEALRGPEREAAEERIERARRRDRQRLALLEPDAPRPTTAARAAVERVRQAGGGGAQRPPGTPPAPAARAPRPRSPRLTPQPQPRGLAGGRARAGPAVPSHLRRAPCRRRAPPRRLARTAAGSSSGRATVQHSSAAAVPPRPCRSAPQRPPLPHRLPALRGRRPQLGDEPRPAGNRDRGLRREPPPPPGPPRRRRAPGRRPPRPADDHPTDPDPGRRQRHRAPPRRPRAAQLPLCPLPGRPLASERPRRVTERRQRARLLLALARHSPAAKASLAATVALLALLAFVGLFVASAPSQPTAAAATGCTATAAQHGQIPAAYFPWLPEAAARYHLGPRGESIVAAIHYVESDWGRSPLPGVAPGTHNYMGAMGPGQFLESSWTSFGVDADGDGRKDPYSIPDSVFATARLLRYLGAPADWRAAIFGYNHAWWYVDEVLAKAATLHLRATCAPATALGPLPAGRLARVEYLARWIESRHLHYCWGGGHAAKPGPSPGAYCWSAAGQQVFGAAEAGLDCSGAVRWLLVLAGYPDPGGLRSDLLGAHYSPGPGRAVTIWSNPDHVFLTIDGRAWGTSETNFAHGPGFAPHSAAGFAPTHPPGL